MGQAPKNGRCMRNLCKHADIIVPKHNSKACLMLDEPYQLGPYTREYIQDLLVRLSIGTEHGGHQAFGSANFYQVLPVMIL